jgi:hypothetical protein
MKLGKFSSVLMALVVGVGVTLAVATPAQAAPKTMSTNDGDPGGRVQFVVNGDTVTLCDIEEDGWAVGLTVNDHLGVAYSLSVGGNGRCVGRSTNLHEGVYVTFTIFLHKTGHPKSYPDYSDWLNKN